MKLFMSGAVVMGVLGLSMSATASLGQSKSSASGRAVISQTGTYEVASLEGFGAPLTLAEEQLLMQGPLSQLETEIDSISPNDDLSSWTDDQIESTYSDQMNETREWMNRLIRNKNFLNEMTRHGVAAKGGGKGMSALSCMSLAIQGEAGAEPYAGKVAVGETIMARAKGNASRVCAVIFAKAQFESMTKRVPKPNADSVRAAKAVLQKGGACGYDHFLNKKLQRRLGRPIPKWVHNFERWGCASKTIGQHTFYSSCNCKRKK